MPAVFVSKGGRMRLQDGSIYISCDNFPAGAVTCFSTKLGGIIPLDGRKGSADGIFKEYTPGEYAGMNPDPRRWPLEIARANAELLGRAAGFRAEDMYMINQVHGDNIKRVYAEERGTGLMRPIEVEADALITNEPDVALTIFTADCTPILLYDPVKRAVAAVHAGWKGTALDIAGKTVKKLSEEFGTEPSDIYAAIGPCISKCCFETHADVPEAMVAVLGDMARVAVTEKRRECGVDGVCEKASAPENEEQKYFVDLKAINRMLLESSGVEAANIEISPHCTACEPELFWSHRRMGLARGSLAAVIVLK